MQCSKGVFLLHVQRASNDLSLLPGDDEAESLAKALPDQIEEAAVQIQSPPGVLLNGGLVDLEHPREELVGNRRSHVTFDRYLLTFHLAPLAPHLIAALAAQTGQVIVEALEAVPERALLEQISRTVRASLPTQWSRSAPFAVRKRAPVTGVKGTPISSLG
jgi:hypothetical protein